MPTSSTRSSDQVPSRWPLGVRLFHWSLIAAVAANLYLLDPPSALLEHVLVGHAVLALMVWRLAYGLIGRHAASRFGAFVTDPRRALRQVGSMMRGRTMPYRGHTPLGGWMIIAFVLVLTGMALSGLVALVGEQRLALTGLGVSFEVGALAATVHRLGADILPILIVVHMLGAAFAWIQGHRPPASENLHARAWTPVVKWTWAGVALIVAAIIGSGVQINRHAAALPVRNAFDRMPLYEESCGDCHDFYHPALLPPSAWRTLMDGLAEHFGEDATLSAQDTRALSQFLTTEARAGERMKVAQGRAALAADAANETIAITLTRYWIDAHKNIEAHQFSQPAVGSASNCGACHGDASTGRFDRHRIALPDGR